MAQQATVTVAIARRFRLSEAVIGATIVAGGTSMPELVASVGGAIGGQYGLAVGNVVGSNSFNVGMILGLVALIAPMQVAPVIARFDWPFMLGAQPGPAAPPRSDDRLRRSAG